MRRFLENKLIFGVTVLLLASISYINASALFSDSSSSNYQISETQFGSSSDTKTCANNYCASVSIGGDNGMRGESANYKVDFGAVSALQPLLEVVIEPGVSDLGNLSTIKTATKTMVVKVRSYLSGGYIVRLVGDPPKYNNYTLNTPTKPTVSRAGVEMFGVNVVHNTSPSIGANPNQLPSKEFSFGEASDNYNQGNKFMYKNGDIVAYSPRASGESDFTISMVVNISNKTPVGSYTSDFSAVVIPVY